MKHDLEQLRQKCPLPALMARVGLGRYAKSSCPSPFRPDQTSSWGIYERNGRWFFKDFGTGECGDEIALLSHLHQQDQQRDFKRLLEVYAGVANKTVNEPEPAVIKSTPSNAKPDTGFLKVGNDDEIKRLSELRRISVEGLHYASSRGVLRFGQWRGFKVYAVTDQSGCLAELRRLDGQVFEGYGSQGPHKSHTLKQSSKNWPLGILEAVDCAGLAFVEGMPDFLAMHQFVLEEGMIGRIAPVAMLTSACDIADGARLHFAGRSVRMYPHSDQPGIDAAERWHEQLISAKASKVDFFNFRAFEVGAGVELKDLCDFNQQRGLAGFNQQRILNNILCQQSIIIR
jgi:hypothetical protein